jgi:hypothetical protein
LDFSDYILEAQHEGPVLSVNVSQDGLKLAVGTSNGTVGILNIEVSGASFQTTTLSCARDSLNSVELCCTLLHSVAFCCILLHCVPALLLLSRYGCYLHGTVVTFVVTFTVLVLLSVVTFTVLVLLSVVTFTVLVLLSVVTFTVLVLLSDPRLQQPSPKPRRHRLCVGGGPVCGPQ